MIDRSVVATYLVQKWNAVKRHVARYQEPYVWVPLSLAFSLGGIIILRAIEPHNGIEIAGTIMNVLLFVFQATVIGFIAWLMKVTYFTDNTDKEDEDLKKRILNGDHALLLACTCCCCRNGRVR
jgi:hypothetical protein